MVSSSKTCSACGVVNEDLGREREWDCPNYGVIHDRNQNAARNLRKLALLAVGEDVVMLPDGEALASGGDTAGETALYEGLATVMSNLHRSVLTRADLKELGLSRYTGEWNEEVAPHCPEAVA